MLAILLAGKRHRLPNNWLSCMCGMRPLRRNTYRYREQALEYDPIAIENLALVGYAACAR